MKKIIFSIVIFFVIVLTLNSFAADDQYKPYLHKPTVPESPKITMYGSYSTNLYAGGATYSYNIILPKGTNGLTPGLTIAYNSQAAKQRPGVLGAGWSISQNYLFREVNNTLNNTADDIFKLVLGDSVYELVYINGAYHTKVESYLKIEKLFGAPNRYQEYWVVTAKDGTKYQFGYAPDSELESNAGYSYAVKWYLNSVIDTHGNTIYYSYLKNPFAEDFGAVYSKEISYNNDKRRKVIFEYEPTERQDKRIVYENSLKIYESRRLKSISVYADNNLVRRYNFEFSYLNSVNSLSALSKISYYGSDNLSILNNISFEYYPDQPGYADFKTYRPSDVFTDSNHKDYGVRLVDVDNDGFVDIVKARGSASEKKTLINNHNGGWANSNSFISPVYLSAAYSSTEIDNGVRFADVNNDGMVDLLVGNGAKQAYLNNGKGWANDSIWIPPIDFILGTTDYGVQLVDFNGDGKVDILQSTDSIKSHG